MSTRTLMITYDLRKPGRDYNSLYAAIKSATYWAHPVESVWLIRTTSSVTEWRDRLKRHIDTNDMLLVLNVAAGWASYGLDSQMVNWMNSHV
jgi:hypothetical protein